MAGKVSVQGKGWGNFFNGRIEHSVGTQRWRG